MSNGNFKFYVLCAALILGFLGFLGYFEIIGEEKLVTQMGDTVEITYTYPDATGVVSTPKTMDYKVGSVTWPAPFDESLIGMKKGETKDITVTFPPVPADGVALYGTFDGQTITFTVTVDNILKCTGSQEACIQNG